MMENIRKIDMHVHAVPQRDLPKPDGRNYPLPGELRRMYDQLNIQGGVLLPQGSAPEGTCDRLSQREARQLAQENPDVFLSWFCNVDPRQGSNSGGTDFAYYLRYYKERGAAGVGEITAPLSIEDPRMLALLGAAEETGMPALIHWGAPGSDYGVRDELHFPGLERVLRRFPRLIVIGHSAVFWAELGGGAGPADWLRNPTGPVAPGGAVPRLMERYPHLYAEFSSLSGANALLRDPEFTYGFLEKFSDRILYGTDFHDPRNLQMDNEYQALSDFLETARETGRLSPAAYRRICRDNALSLLKGAGA